MNKTQNKLQPKPQRIPPIQLSRKQLDPTTVQSDYIAGYCHFTVTSHFLGHSKLEDLIFQIIEQKFTSVSARNRHELMEKDAPI